MGYYFKFETLLLKDIFIKILINSNGQAKNNNKIKNKHVLKSSIYCFADSFDKN